MNIPVRAKTFKSGNSEAVRLPKGIGFGIGVELRIERDGDRVLLTPVSDPATENARLRALVADLQAIGAPEDGVQSRDPFEFPERRGL